jgi:hypothetical protein
MHGKTNLVPPGRSYVLMHEPDSAQALKDWLKTNGGEFHQDAIYIQGSQSNFSNKRF